MANPAPIYTQVHVVPLAPWNVGRNISQASLCHIFHHQDFKEPQIYQITLPSTNACDQSTGNSFKGSRKKKNKKRKASTQPKNKNSLDPTSASTSQNIHTKPILLINSESGHPLFDITIPKGSKNEAIKLTLKII